LPTCDKRPSREVQVTARLIVRQLLRRLGYRDPGQHSDYESLVKSVIVAFDLEIEDLIRQEKQLAEQEQKRNSWWSKIISFFRA